MSIRIDWEIFYESLWQFIITIFFQLVVSISMTYLVVVMIRRFWCHKRSNKRSKLKLSINNVSSNPTSSTQSPVSSSSPRHGHKKTSHEQEPDASNGGSSLKLSFKVLTIVYLICFLLYALTSMIFRLSVILFKNVSIWCWIPDYMSIWFVFSRIALHCIYLTRYIYSTIQIIHSILIHIWFAFTFFYPWAQPSVVCVVSF